MGGKSYQHPKRNTNTFNSHLDDFSILIISTSLFALSEKPELHNKYNNGQNIIFDQSDFLDFENSELIKELNSIHGLKGRLNAIHKALTTDSINIEGLAELIEDAITKEEYGEELEKAKQIIKDNYDLLLNDHKQGLCLRALKIPLLHKKRALQVYLKTLGRN
ncbi:MAG: hypothetical protein GXO89_11655 [Chlorobi bacterium]|nr:hypothetical protein [Chlorobiota bacterium]